MIKINGKDAGSEDINLSSYLKEQGYVTARIVIEKNGQMLPKSLYNETILKDNDVIEIVSFVGGG